MTSPSPAPLGRVSWLLLASLVLITALRLAAIGTMELSPDESYYYQWSQRLDWAYYSKGPGVALTIRAGTDMFGANEFGVRFFSPILALGTSLILFGLARRLYGETAAVWSVLLLNATPIFNAGALLMTIDPLSIFFWTAGLSATWRALERAPRFSLWWPLAGLLTGLGFLCKYTNAMFALSLLLFLLFSRPHRAEFRRPGFWCFLVLFAACTLPPIVWNAQHEWVTISHLLARGKLDRAFAIHPGEWFQFLGLHFGVYSPLIFAGILLALYEGCRLARRETRERFLVWFALPLLALYFFLSLKESGEANWTAPAMVSAGILTAGLWVRHASASRAMRRFGFVALGVGIALSLAALNSDSLRRAGIPWSYAKDPSSRLRGWSEAASAIADLRADYEARLGTPVFLIANKYQTASSLAFYFKNPRIEQPGHPPVYIPESQMIQNQFSFWPRYDEFVPIPPGQPASHPDEVSTEEQGINLFTGHNALYITDRDDASPVQSVRSGFSRVELVGDLEFRRLGFPLRTFRVFACHDYHTQDL